MSADRPTINKSSQSRSRAHFRDGVYYLISGVLDCTKQMQECPLASEEDQETILSLTDQLKAKIEFFVSVHNKKETEPERASEDTVESQKVQKDQEQVKNLEIQSELWRERRRNKKIVETNQKLKTKVRRLKVRLSQLESRIGLKVDSSALEIQNSLKSMLENLKTDLERSNREMAESIQQTSQTHLDSLTSRLPRYPDLSDSFKHQSEDFSTKMDLLSEDLTEKTIDETPSELNFTINKMSDNFILGSPQKDTFTPLFSELSLSLKSSQKEAKEYADSAQQAYEKGFESMMQMLNKTLGATQKVEQKCSYITQRVQQSCNHVADKVNRESLILSRKVEKVALEVKEFSEVVQKDPIYKQMNEKVEFLYETHLESINKIKIDEMKVAVDRIIERKQRKWEDEDPEEGSIGGHWTHIALKNNRSYLVGTWGSGLEVIEDGNLVYKGKMPGEDHSLWDVVYIPCLNCYLLATPGALYRKEVDGSAPSVYLTIDCGYRIGAFLRYSDLHRRLIINKEGQNIAVIDPVTKKIEIEVDKNFQDHINDFKLFGEKQDKVAAVTKDGYAILYDLIYAQKWGSVTTCYKLKLIEKRNEQPKSIAVCPKNELILIEVGQYSCPCYCSRMMILKIAENDLIVKACLDHYSIQTAEKYALGNFGYVGRHLLWFGLSGEKNGAVQVYDYDSKTNEFKELRGKRESHLESAPCRLLRLGNKFYYTGNKGQLVSLSVTI